MVEGEAYGIVTRNTEHTNMDGGTSVSVEELLDTLGDEKIDATCLRA